MKKFFILISLLILSSPAWSQDYSGDDQYPESDAPAFDSGEFTNPRAVPTSDYEEVPREEQEYVPDPKDEELAPEEAYEADEEYLE